MYNLRIALLVFFTLSLLFSCASWKKYDYHSKAWQIEEVRPIEIPPGFDSSDMEEYYSITYLGDSPSSVIDITQPPVKRAYKPQVKRVPKPPTKHVYKPPAKRVPKPPTKHVHKPPAKRVPKPPTKHVHKPPAKRVPKPQTKHVHKPPAKEYYPIPDIVHENMRRSELGEVPKRL